MSSRPEKRLMEDEAKEIAILLIAAIKNLHEKKIYLGILTSDMLRFDEKTALYIDAIWCIVDQITDIKIDYLTPMELCYLGRSC